jgi:hypothetical protein
LKSHDQRLPKTSILTSGLPGVRFDDRLIASGEGEEAEHQDERHDRVEDLDRQVVAQLHRQARLALAAAVDHRGPDDEAPGDDSDREQHDPRVDPERGDARGVVGDAGAAGQEAGELRLRASGQNDRHDAEDGDQRPAGQAGSARPVHQELPLL